MSYLTVIRSHDRKVAINYYYYYYKNSSGDDIENVNFYAVRPESYPNSLK